MKKIPKVKFGTRAFERFENEIPIDRLKFDERVKVACTSCEMFGKNFACPPYSPDLQVYSAAAKTVLVICYRVAVEHTKAAAVEEQYLTAYQVAKEHLHNNLNIYHTRGYTVAGCGPCEECAHCAVEKGSNICKFPRKRIFSLESLGINLVELSKEIFGFTLEWSGPRTAANFVSAIGAVFK